MVNCVDGFCTKIRPDHLAVNGALKTVFVFHCGKIPAKQVLCSRRSKVSASRPYAPDTRGVCFQGPSRALWYLSPRGRTPHGTKRGGRGMKSVRTSRGVCRTFSTFSAKAGYTVLRFVPLLCAVTAGTGQPPSCIAGLKCR